MTDTQAGLLPCPFCGEQPKLWHETLPPLNHNDLFEDRRMIWTVECRHCQKAEVSRVEQHNAIAAWNTRQASGAAVQVPERLGPIHLKLLQRGLNGRIVLSNDMVMRSAEYGPLQDLHRMGLATYDERPVPDGPRSPRSSVITDAGRAALARRPAEAGGVNGCS